jgi:hypothetical protein
MATKRRNRDRALARRANWEAKRAMTRAKNQITLPAEVSRALHVREGDEV